MLSYNKDELKESLTVDQIFNFLEEYGGEPEYTSFGIISRTICHNLPQEGSRKLYYYDNTKLFKCYTGCDSTFDIFELFIKIKKNQENIDVPLNRAIAQVANFFGFFPEEDDNEEQAQIEDWGKIHQYENRKEKLEKENNHYSVSLKIYDDSILSKLIYPKISLWEKEGISEEIIRNNKIGYYPVGEQITIPHYDINGNFIGLRGRALIQEEAELYGKYRPLRISKVLYKHPLGLNLYNLNNSKENIRLMKKAIVFEGEKSSLLYQTFFDTDISVACCGSNISDYQVSELMNLGVEEIIIAFDRQFQEIGDKEFSHLKRNLISIHKKYSKYVNISFIFDSKMITSYKASPIDEGKDKFLKLFKERIVL